MPEEFKEKNKESDLLGDIRAILSQLKYAKNLLRHDPNLDEVVNYGFPFEFKLKYAGRKENIERILKAAEEKACVSCVGLNEDRVYKLTKKGEKLSSVGYVKEE